MVLTLDSIAKEVCSDVGDVNFQQFSRVKRYVEDTITHLTMMLRKGAVLQTASISIVNNEGVIPNNNCFGVLYVKDTNGVRYEVVDNTEYRTRENNQTNLPTVQVFEDVPYWRIKVLNSGSTSSTLIVDYLISSKNPAILNDYYRKIIVSGSVSRYYNTRLTPENVVVAREAKSNFKTEVDMLETLQAGNDGQISQMKGIIELEIQDPVNSNGLRNNMDFYGPGVFW